MSLLSLILSSLKYYRKTYLSILAGTVISTAVLTGALIVGDSVKYSLEQLTGIRLGKTRFAVQAGERFFRQELAGELAKQSGGQVAAILELEGISVNNDNNTRINRVNIIGINDQFLRFWEISDHQITGDEAILSRNTAEKLKLKTGDAFLLKLHRQSRASANAPFVSEKEPLVVIRLKVAAIAPDDQMGRYSLKSNQSAPYNIFVPLETIAGKAGVRGLANVLLFADSENNGLSMSKLDSLLRLTWQPEDAGLEFRQLSGNKNYEIRSAQIFIDDNTTESIYKSIPGAQPVLTYLVNAISTKEKSTPYSFVTATDISDFTGGSLSEHEFLISNWLADDLGVKQGDSLILRYFRMGALRKLTEDSSRFCIKYILPLTNPLFDKTLMPEFPGMSDAGNCRDWETGAPVNLDRIRDKDEQYWNEYKGTPKAFVSIGAGKKIWDNAFGNATAFRFFADSADLPAFKSGLMSNIVPSQKGLIVKDVYAEGKSAAANSTDFGGLFLSLSFFIIAAALLLTALIFSLHAQKRISEAAILSTLGFTKRDIIRILFLESFLVVIAGGILGVGAGIFYNKLLLLGLNTLWQDAVRTSSLHVNLVPSTLLTGFASGACLALLTLFLVLKRNLRNPLSIMVKGFENSDLRSGSLRKKISSSVSLVSSLTAVSLIVLNTDSLQSGSSEVFLSAGGLLLVAGIAFLYYSLLRFSIMATGSSPGFFSLCLRNISRNRNRTTATVTLLAIGVFSVIITGANRKTFYGTENTRSSGTGGFLLWAETTVPLLNDLNSPEGREKYGLADEPFLQQVNFVQMLRLDGNDASCLNLNQVAQPALLGISPEYFDKQQSFSFLKLNPLCDKQHPWLTLNKQLAPGIIPGYADQTVIQWGLRKNIGDTLVYSDEKGNPLKVVLTGGLDNSIFQGNVLISAELFRQYFPSTAGSAVMLADGNFQQQKQIAERLSYLFQDYGMMVVPASERLIQFNSVENTYLSVFMLLGGLGVLIGTIGLGIVLLRNMAERKEEIALYKALGFKHKYILKLILAENLFVLLAGIITGTIAALAGILPSFFSPAFQLPAGFLLIIILVIALSGIAWIYFSVRLAMKKNLIGELRKE